MLDHIDNIRVVQESASCVLGESSNVHVRRDGLDTLAHDKPLEYRRPEATDLSFKVASEVGGRRPSSEARLITDADHVEVCDEPRSI